VNVDGNGDYTFSHFNPLDPQDKGFINVCIQQIMTVTPTFDTDLLNAYLDQVPADLKQQKIV
jgi:hypothetical protein